MTITNLDDVPLVISVPELAQILRISRNTAYELVRSGQVHSKHVGAQIRISKSALISYINPA